MEFETEELVSIIDGIYDFEDESERFYDGVYNCVKSLSNIFLKQSIQKTQISLLKAKEKQQKYLEQAVKQEDIDKAKGIITAIDFYLGSDNPRLKIPTTQELVDIITDILIDANTIDKWTKYKIKKQAETIIGYYANNNFCIDCKPIESWRNVVKGWLRRLDYLPNMRNITEIRDVYNSLDE